MKPYLRVIVALAVAMIQTASAGSIRIATQVLTFPDTTAISRHSRVLTNEEFQKLNRSIAQIEGGALITFPTITPKSGERVEYRTPKVDKRNPELGSPEVPPLVGYNLVATKDLDGYRLVGEYEATNTTRDRHGAGSGNHNSVKLIGRVEALVPIGHTLVFQVAEYLVCVSVAEG